MTLYNLRETDGIYTITKFTTDLEVESSYQTSFDACNCPAGARPTCRHRQMLPKMIAEDICNQYAFLEFESGTVLVPETELKVEPQRAISTPSSEQRLDSVTEHFIGPDWREIARVANVPITDLNLAHPSIGPIKRRI